MAHPQRIELCPPGLESGWPPWPKMHVAAAVGIEPTLLRLTGGRLYHLSSTAIFEVDSVLETQGCLDLDSFSKAS